MNGDKEAIAEIIVEALNLPLIQGAYIDHAEIKDNFIEVMVHSGIKFKVSIEVMK